MQQGYKGFFVPLLCVPKEGVPPRKGTSAFRALKGSLAGHMIAGTARTRTIGRSDSVPSVSAPMGLKVKIANRRIKPLIIIPDGDPTADFFVFWVYVFKTRFARRVEDQAAGHLFFGLFLWSEQRNERKKSSLKTFRTRSLFVQRRGTR